ncbi:type II toxin-antitoxin system MqsA family antitoxin [Corallococcus sp. AB050B]|nr:type II toxin-antitoxin system MqsA family antitoxin [Corallococcus sp. AB050B]
MKPTAHSPNCPNCGASQGIILRKGRFEGTYNKLPITIEDAEEYFCKNCGEEFYTRDQDRRLSQHILDAARQKLGILQPDQIIAIRKNLGLSQESMEDLLGLGDKVVTRWETGRVVPGKTTDILLRLLSKHPGLVNDLRSIKQEAFT